ncbi:MAG: type III restriction endonuclease subunit R [Planctomycetota bacterium]|nr:MAG: type III restriction endonuclease subunit R [Planctomycetota bacterium]
MSAIDLKALEPLYAPWEEPYAHRIAGDKKDAPAKVVKGRRKSPITMAQNIRAAVRDWREANYNGASDTTKYLLMHWFERSHRRKTPAGDEFEFRYYFCQREALETFVYLREVRGLTCLSQLVAEFGGQDKEVAALGVTEEDDAITRYAFKLATGAGKTKCMSLAIVWSYFHALRESDSPMARHFVMIAPNLTVYERLKDDFGNGKIFDDDPLIPTEWRGDFNLTVVLQDEAGGVASGGVLYLTNIHRLYEQRKGGKSKGETFEWMGPAVSKASALDTSEALRQRITAHQRVMVLNDEAHHVWDPDSAWNEAIRYLHDTIKTRTSGGLVSQLDFSATPKDNKAQYFKHVVCDTPLGEAVDAGIVKTPLLGKADKKLTESPDENAAWRFERHLVLGYERWKKSRDEWAMSGKRPLLFVMCEDTKAADEITQRLNTDSAFADLNGKAFNLHTNLKGQVKKLKDGRVEFVESEKEIKDEDLKALRELSRNLDSGSSPYQCIVSVLMLREGWDVRNVTVIVPLRPYSSGANILPEQTLGRGLRRMTPPGQANEVVTVVEHPAFASLYKQELAQQGLPIEEAEVEDIPSTTISIFPDPAKDQKKLEIAVPTLTAGLKQIPKLEGLTFADVRKQFQQYKKLPLGQKTDREVEYEGRALLTDEVVERFKINLPLLSAGGVGAISYYVKQLETICKLRGTHATLAPLLQQFIEEELFDLKTTIADDRLAERLGDGDVAEHIRAVFVPLIRARTTKQDQRTAGGEPMLLSTWKPFQVTMSERHPAFSSGRTLFNLVTCNRALEVALSKFLDQAADIAAFAKNAGPQCLRIDYLADGGRMAFYTPDFFARDAGGNYYLIEAKGREDRDVAAKARAAQAWCESASASGVRWTYLYVQQGALDAVKSNSMKELAGACAPALHGLLNEADERTKFPLFAALLEDKPKATATEFIDNAALEALPGRYRKAIDDAVTLFYFVASKPGMNFASAFNGLLGPLDEAARSMIMRLLVPEMPTSVPDQKAWFTPYISGVSQGAKKGWEEVALKLKKTLVFNNGFSPIGLLRSCLDFAVNQYPPFTGVFEAIKGKFQFPHAQDLLARLTEVNDFRNMYVAHQEKELTDAALAKSNLQGWVALLRSLHQS